MQVVFVVEEINGGFLAYCDELRATASGATEQEAIQNLRAAVSRLLDEYGPEVREEMARRKAVPVEI